MIEVLARPEPKPGHEDTVKKIEERVNFCTKELSSLWGRFLEKHGLEEPSSWPSKFDKQFKEEYPESESIKETVLKSFELLAKHTVTPEESAQNHAIIASMRSPRKVTYYAEVSLMVSEDALSLMKEASGILSQEKVIKIDRQTDKMVTLSAADLVRIHEYVTNLLDADNKMSWKSLSCDQAKNLASWCSYWGNLGHGCDIYPELKSP